MASSNNTTEAEEADSDEERTELPIERGFPIEQVNDLAEKEGRAKIHHRPIYTMHKWWARRLGCVFRTISLYTLLDDSDKVSIHEYAEDIDGTGEGTVQGSLGGGASVEQLMKNVDMTDADALWELYTQDVRVNDKKVLDPFMGGGTSLVEASRFGAEVHGQDLNPVAWFVTQKELQAGQTDVETLTDAFDEVESKVASKITSHYKTPCPNGNHEADIVAAFWVKELDCVGCGKSVPLFNDYRVGKGRYGDDGYNVYCREGDSIVRVDDWKDEFRCTCGDEPHTFVPSEGTTGSGNYSCPDCGLSYSIKDAIEEQDGVSLRLYAIEYYCPHCDEAGEEKEVYRGYKTAVEEDTENFESAVKKWEENEDLREYVPTEDIPRGAITESSSISGNDIFDHGYQKWTDMYNGRQLYTLSTLLKAIDEVEDQHAKEYLLLAFSECLRFNSMVIGYQASNNHIQDLWKTNSFESPDTPAESNVWGTEYGMGSFQKTWRLVRRGVEYAHAPTDRELENGSTEETPEFAQPIGESAHVKLGDSRNLDFEDEFDAVITDPPYYDNIIYSEVANFHYVWLKILLEGEYEGFDSPSTPQAESVVANPAVGKDKDKFESEIKQAFSGIHDALVDDGTLVFSYHHNSADSWGELLKALCDVKFEVTATYPVNADTHKFIKGEAVSFDIIVVARPIEERTQIQWRQLRREIVRTARETRKTLEEERELSVGDIGVIEMGECFREYSKHHGKVIRGGEVMDAKDVVEEIYGIIQEGSEEGAVDTFLRLLDHDVDDFNTVNKLVRGTATSIEELEDRRLIETNGDIYLGTWDNEKRVTYIQERANGDGSKLSTLAKAQLLRYKYDIGASVQNQLDAWDGMDSELHDILKDLSEATGDETYERIIEGNYSLGTFDRGDSDE